VIAKFFMYLPFELFITDEEHFGMQGEFLDGPWFGTRFVIPIAWAYTERPDPTGTIHAITSKWVSAMTQPVFSDSIFFDDRRVARVTSLFSNLSRMNSTGPKISSCKVIRWLRSRLKLQMNSCPDSAFMQDCLRSSR
jgi:hypothetical protein